MVMPGPSGTGNPLLVNRLPSLVSHLSGQEQAEAGPTSEEQTDDQPPREEPPSEPLPDRPIMPVGAISPLGDAPAAPVVAASQPQLPAGEELEANNAIFADQILAEPRTRSAVATAPGEGTSSLKALAAVLAGVATALGGGWAIRTYGVEAEERESW